MTKQPTVSRKSCLDLIRESSRSLVHTSMSQSCRDPTSLPLSPTARLDFKFNSSLSALISTNFSFAKAFNGTTYIPFDPLLFRIFCSIQTYATADFPLAVGIESIRLPPCETIFYPLCLGRIKFSDIQYIPDGIFQAGLQPKGPRVDFPIARHCDTLEVRALKDDVYRQCQDHRWYAGWPSLTATNKPSPSAQVFPPHSILILILTLSFHSDGFSAHA